MRAVREFFCRQGREPGVPARARRIFLAHSLAWPLGQLLGAGCGRTSAASAVSIGQSFAPVLAESVTPALVPPSPVVGRTREALPLLARNPAPPAEALAVARLHWAVGVAVRWNALARELVAAHRIDLLSASRLYAVLSVAQHDACYYAGRAVRQSCVRGAIAAASRAVLTHFFPVEEPSLSRRGAELADILLADGLATPVALGEGDGWGERVGRRVVAHAAGDGASAAGLSVSRAPAVPGSGRWLPSPGRTALGPGWGAVRPWLVGNVAAFRAPPPPPFQSPAFTQAVAEVRQLSDGSTNEQQRIAALWADGVGSYTPAGRWNKIAADCVVEQALGEPQATRVFTLLNLALMDAGIVCWESKFHYNVVRPSQVDAGIATPVGLPEFPSYTSAHASFSGAASTVLAALFPARAVFVTGKAQEASASRLYGGIHYRFDADAGLAQGRAVARLALAWGRLSA
jgi:hypothetical protein